jgi:predicted GNAT family N-acyltransferase
LAMGILYDFPSISVLSRYLSELIIKDTSVELAHQAIPSDETESMSPVSIPSLNVDPMSPPIHVKLVKEEAQLKEIYKLRYYIYKYVIKIPPVSMDDETQEFRETIDESAYILGAYAGDKLIGTVRGFIYKEMDPKELELVTLYNALSYKDASIANSAEVNRLSVLDEYQKSGVSFMLMQEIVAVLYQVNPELKYIFIEAVSSFVAYYQTFHFQVIGSPQYNPHYKRELYLMALDLNELIDKEASTAFNIVFKL